MSRNLVLALGTLLWVSFAIDAILHLISGNWIVPALAIVLTTTGVVAYHARERAQRISRARQVDRGL